LKFQLCAFENERTNTGSVGNFSGSLPGPRGHQQKDQFLEVNDKKKWLR